jgi:SAM-dependent methyltransferase
MRRMHEAKTVLTVDDIAAWFHASRTPLLSKDEAIVLAHTMHPRTVFVKTLAPGAHLLDMGAGDGSLEVYRRWPAPQREDLRMYAYALSKGARFDAYDGWEIGDWETRPPGFPGIAFDAIFCAHFIEYVEDAVPFVRWTGERLRAGGRVYLEWPSPFSAVLPKVSELVQRGIPITISNFHDDANVKRIHDRAQVVSELIEVGFFIEAQGYVSMPLVEEEVLAHFANGSIDDRYVVQLAYWSKTRWAQYLVAVRR